MRGHHRLSMPKVIEEVVNVARARTWGVD